MTGKPIVGYLIGGQGQHGQAYNYDFTGSGVFVEADNGYMFCRVPVAEVKIRGLRDDRETYLSLRRLIPAAVFQKAYMALLTASLTDLTKECFAAITFNDGQYDVVVPQQQGDSGSVDYECVPHTVVEIHTHGRARPFFSSTDNKDEQGFKIYMGLGCLMTRLKLRLGCYGYFLGLVWGDVFEGSLPFGLRLEKNDEETD